jgi:biopolymer transport protein TolQ
MESVWVHLVSVSSETEISVSGLLLKASLVVQLVLLVLLFMSVLCWWVIGYKALSLKRARVASKLFLEEFWSATSLDEIWARHRPDAEQNAGGSSNHHCPTLSVFQAGQMELEKLRRPSQSSTNLRDTIATRVAGTENIERALRRTRNAQLLELESWTSFLATTASAAPFVGLFGTVWGIMESFLNIARQGNATLTTVAPGIAEALIATAIGLVAAIPAVIAYNWLSGHIRELEADMDNFSNDYLNFVRCYYEDTL